MERQFQQDVQEIEAGYTTVGEILGFNSSSKNFKSFITQDFSYSNSDISQAGLAGLNPTGLQTIINITAQNTAHYLHQYALCFQAKFNQYALSESGLYLVEGQSCQITKMNLSTGQQNYLAAARQHIMKPEDFQKYKQIIGASQLVDVAKDELWLSHYGVVEGGYYARSYDITYGAGDSATTYTFINYMIPLHLIFNEISQVEDSGAIILCDGNTLQFKINFIDPSKCLTQQSSNAAQNPTYTINNIHLARCYTGNLTDEQLMRFRSSKLMYRLLRGYNLAGQQTVGVNNALTGSVSQGQYAKGLYFFFVPKISGLMDTSGDASENVVTFSGGGGAAHISRLFYPMSYFELPVREVILQVGAETRVLNAYQLRNTDQLSLLSDEISCPYISHLQKQRGVVYYIPMERFSKDLFGYSNSPAPMQITINMDINAKTLPRQRGNWLAEANNGVAGLNQFELKAYLVTQSLLECDKGQWRM